MSAPTRPDPTATPIAPSPASAPRRSPPLWPRLVRAPDVRAALKATLHAVLVGLSVGAVAIAFYLLLRAVEHLLLGTLVGYRSLLPHGEPELELPGSPLLPPFALALLPALGGLGAGLLVHRYAPEIAGGGGDAYISSFHTTGPGIRRRVAWLKILATTLTLGTGGSAGREGPTMQVGAAIADRIARLLRLSRREQRRLLVAGTAAGLTAMFGTPLGAALLATEVLYRDDFESDALVPAILASVAAFALVGSVLPEQAELFAHAPRYVVTLQSLALCIPLVALLVLAARAFVASLRVSRRLFARVERPWLRPALGGLALGVLGTVGVATLGPKLGLAGTDIGLLGGGYGIAQAAITGDTWLTPGWRAAALLGALAIVKMVTTSLTLGSGGVGGDFGPSLAIGATLGGAFGHLARAFVDPSIDPGFFALVGMGGFYGALAKVPLSALVIVCELTGTYDLLVPLMLTNVLGSLLLRKTSLYRQPPTRFDSPLHAAEDTLDVLKRMRVDEVCKRVEVESLPARAGHGRIVEALDGAPDWQVVFPVLDAEGVVAGVVRREHLVRAVHEGGLERVLIAADLAEAAPSLRPSDDLHTALERLLDSDLRQLPVLDRRGHVVALLDEHDVGHAYHDLLAALGARSATETPLAVAPGVERDPPTQRP